MCPRNYAVTRVDNFRFSSINEMPSRGRGSGDRLVECMVTVIAANLASSHGIRIGVWDDCAIRILHGAVHHNMDMLAIADDDLFINLKSYFEWKLSEKRRPQLSLRAIRYLTESASELQRERTGLLPFESYFLSLPSTTEMIKPEDLER